MHAHWLAAAFCFSPFSALSLPAALSAPSAVYVRKTTTRIQDFFTHDFLVVTAGEPHFEEASQQQSALSSLYITSVAPHHIREVVSKSAHLQEESNSLSLSLQSMCD